MFTKIEMWPVNKNKNDFRDKKTILTRARYNQEHLFFNLKNFEKLNYKWKV